MDPKDEPDIDSSNKISSLKKISFLIYLIAQPWLMSMNFLEEKRLRLL